MVQISQITCPLFLAAKKYPDNIALIQDKKTLSYKELEKAVSDMAERLKAFNFKKGERIAIVLPNSISYIIVLFALWRMELVACPVSTRLPSRAIQKLLKNINCAYIITSPDDVALVSGAPQKKISIWDIASYKSKGSAKPPKKISLDQDAAILFTSGSTGEPKAALLSYGNFYYNALGANENIPFGANDRWLLILPLYHVGGLGIIFRTLLGGGGIVLPPTSFLNITPTITKKGVTHVSLVPTQLHRLLWKTYNRMILKRLKCILLGGSAIPETLLAQCVREKLSIYKTYGLTEMASQVATTKNGEVLTDIHTPASVLPHREVKLSADGEILVRGKTLFKGYIKGELLEEPFDDGWFKTGDLGEFDASGRLTVKGRKDNMFISGGENIQPEEIEKELLKVQDIEQAVVVPVDNEEFGVRPVAFIKLCGRTKHLKPKLLSEVLAHELPRFKIPEAFYAWPEDLEKKGLKVNRRELLRIAQEKR